MPIPLLAEQDQMTIEEFLAFTATRPDDEKWELIEGQPVLNATPTDFHQAIVANLIFELSLIRRAKKQSWLVIPGVGARVPASPRSLPAPDVMIKQQPGTGSHVSNEALVLFEILPPSNTPADQAWRRRVYASIPNLQHYVTVAQKGLLVIRHDRANNWSPERITSLDHALELPTIRGSIPLRAIYRDTPHAT